MSKTEAITIALSVNPSWSVAGMRMILAAMEAQAAGHDLMALNLREQANMLNKSIEAIEAFAKTQPKPSENDDEDDDL